MNQDMKILEVKNVSKEKGNFTLETINFSMDQGYILGVIGRNGTGKTTLLRTLLGSYIPSGKDEWDILADGISIKENEQEYKKRIGFVLNDTPFPLYYNSIDCGKEYGRLYEEFDFEKYTEYLDKYELPKKVKIKKLSKGQQLKQQLAFALSYHPAVYIMDEATSSLDIKFREVFYGEIRNLMKDGTKGIVFVSHFMEELEMISDYVLWMETKDRGHIGTQTYFGTVDDLLENYQIIDISREDAKKEKLDIVKENGGQYHKEVLIKSRRQELPKHLKAMSRTPTLKELVYDMEKRDNDDRGNEKPVA